MLVAATNRASDLDPALFSPGRFDRVVHFDLPPRSDRMEIARYYLARKQHDRTVSAAFVADVTAGYTPARIERLLDEALIVALRGARTEMSYHDVISAQVVSEAGLAHEVGYHPEEKRRVAMHEAGHALQAALAGRDVKLASVLRRAGTLGLVAHGDVDERFLRTPSEARDLMAIALAGRAAEIQEFGEASSGIAGDLATATEIAAQLVGTLGERQLAEPAVGQRGGSRQPGGEGAARPSHTGEGRRIDAWRRRASRVRCSSIGEPCWHWPTRCASTTS